MSNGVRHIIYVCVRITGYNADRDVCRFRQCTENPCEIGGEFFVVCDQEKCCLYIERRTLTAHYARKLYGNSFETAETVNGLGEVVETVLADIHNRLDGGGRGS